MIGVVWVGARGTIEFVPIESAAWKKRASGDERGYYFEARSRTYEPAREEDYELLRRYLGE